MHMPQRGPPFVGAFPHSDPQRYSPDPTLTGELGSFNLLILCLYHTHADRKNQVVK